MVRPWFTHMISGATDRVFMVFTALVLVLALSAVFAPAKEAAAKDGGGMQVEDLAEDSAAQPGPAPEEPSWQVTRPVDKTIIPLDATLLYDSKKASEPEPKAEPKAEPEAKPVVVPTPEPKPEPVKVEAKPEPVKVEAKPVAKPKATPAGKGLAGPLKAFMDGKTLVITIPTNRPPGDMEYLNVFGPKRLALDLLGSWDQKGKVNVLRLNNDLVKHVVVGEHSDRLRLVVHFTAEKDTRPVTPQFERTETGFTVRIPLD